MTNLIASNSVTRRYLKRGELMAKRRAEAAQNDSHKAECKSRVDRATSLCSLRDKQEQEVSTERRNSIYYKDNNPFGNKIHATQRMKLSSKPLI